MQHATIKKATVLPYKKLIAIDGFIGGVVLSDEYNQLRHIRRGSIADKFYETPKNLQYISGDFQYSGPLYHHFGHVMAEFIHRIIPSKRINGEKTWVFTIPPNPIFSDFESAPKFIRDIYEFLGVNLKKYNCNKKTVNFRKPINPFIRIITWKRPSRVVFERIRRIF